MKLYGGNEGSPEVEARLHAMRGDASRAPDLTTGILSRVAEQRPFADRRTLRIRRWGRLVGTAVAVGLAVCAGMVALQWRQIAPGFVQSEQPIGGVIDGALADVRAGTKTIKDVPARLAFMVRGGVSAGTPGGGPAGRTDPEDAVIVRSVTTNVIVPMGVALRVTPTMDVTEAELGLAQRVLAGGQRMLDQAGRFASSLKSGGLAGGGDIGNETYADRLSRAVGGVGGGAPLVDGGPQ